MSQPCGSGPLICRPSSPQYQQVTDSQSVWFFGTGGVTERYGEFSTIIDPVNDRGGLTDTISQRSGLHDLGRQGPRKIPRVTKLARTAVTRHLDVGQSPGLPRTSNRRPTRLLPHLRPRVPCAISRQVRQRGIRSMGAPTGTTCSAQQSRGCHRQQTGAYRLGRVVQRPTVSPSNAAASGSPMAVEKTLRLESLERFHFSTATSKHDERYTDRNKHGRADQKSSSFTGNFKSQHRHDHSMSEARPGCEGNQASVD